MRRLDDPFPCDQFVCGAKVNVGFRQLVSLEEHKLIRGQTALSDHVQVAQMCAAGLSLFHREIALILAETPAAHTLTDDPQIGPLPPASIIRTQGIV